MNKSLLPLAALALVTCTDPMGQPGTGQSRRTGLAIHFDVQPGVLSALDSGHVLLRGPSPSTTLRTIRATPGAPVTVDSIVPGVYTLSIRGFNGGGVSYYGQVVGVTVREDEVTPVTMGFPSFLVTNVTAPATAPSRTFTVNFTGVAVAASYRVEAATDAAFTQNLVFATASAGQSSAAITTVVDGAHYLRARGVTPEGVAGQWTTAPQVLVNCSGSATFNYTGASQSFTVPACVTSITIDAFGAQGGAGAGAAGLGGRATGTRSVAGGAVLTVMVGGAGQAVSSTGNAAGFAGGFNGGGRVFEYTTWAGQSEGPSGTGGGASDVRLGGSALANRIIVAGGGAGGGNTSAGGGGGANGGTGVSGGGNVVGGGGGTQAGGGTTANCCASYPNTPGVLGVGGDGYRDGAGSGGGGGGYYGGGGGQFAGGGGGSSYLGGVTGGTTSSGVRAGNGQVVITW